MDAEERPLRKLVLKDGAKPIGEFMSTFIKDCQTEFGYHDFLKTMLSKSVLKKYWDPKLILIMEDHYRDCFIHRDFAAKHPVEHKGMSMDKDVGCLKQDVSMKGLLNTFNGFFAGKEEFELEDLVAEVRESLNSGEDVVIDDQIWRHWTSYLFNNNKQQDCRTCYGCTCDFIERMREKYNLFPDGSCLWLSSNGCSTHDQCKSYAHL